MDPERPSPPTPGWYPDPSGQYEVRYWDGQSWTEHTAHPQSLAGAGPGGGPPLSSLGKRLGGALLDSVLSLVTFGIGWLIWAAFTFSRGQTPGKALLGMRVVIQDTGRSAGWGVMFLRTIVIQWGLALVSMYLVGLPWLIAVCLIFAGPLRQTGWDRLAGTVVVDDPGGAALARAGG